MATMLCFFLLAGWQSQTSGVNVDLYNVDCVSRTEAWVVGLSGTILHTTDGGANWVRQTSNTSNDLYGVDFINSSTGWAVGSGPTILYTSTGGSAWGTQSAATSKNLLNVVFIDASRGWATGVTGAIVGTTNGGVTWTEELTGEWAWLWGVTAVSTNCAWAFGGDWFQNIAPIFYYNGSSWRKQFDVTQTRDGNSIAAVNSSVVWAVGGDGVIYFTSNGGSSWSRQTSGTTEMLRCIEAKSVNSCWAVGSGGMILHTSNGGQVWLRQPSAMTDTLFGVSMFDTLVGWTVGKNGQIFYTIDGGVGIDDQELICPQSTVVKIFPNPVAARVNVNFVAPQSSEMTVRLFDTNGRFRTLLYQGMPKTSFIFDLAPLPSGVYFIEIATPDERMTHRIVKVR